MEKMKDITFPENAITKDFVEILYNENENEIRLYFPKEAMRIREIVKEAQFKFDWVALCWKTYRSFKNEEYSNSWKII